MSAAEIRGWARDVQRFSDEAPKAAMVIVERAILDRLRADSGDGSLSHGRQLGRATTTVTARRGEAEVVASGSRAVWGILEGGRRAVEIDAGKGRVLRTPYGPRRRVRVGASRGKDTFSEGAERGLTEAQRDVEQAWGDL